MLRQFKLAAALLAAATLSLNAYAKEDDPELKRDAVSRVVESHDPALSIGIGRVYVKQAALLAARDLLAQRGAAAGLDKAGWNLQTEPWRAAERELMAGVDDLIQRKVARGAWVQEPWSALISQTLNAEEADEIAVHFQTEGGQLQRRVIEWFVGELTLQTYTFTDRLKYGVSGSEQEMRDLQVVTYERIFRGIQDFSPYPDAVRFAMVDPGVKYFKMMAIQGVHAVHLHLEQVADEARAMIRARAALADPHIARAQAGAR
jgi:hypothetical protein